MSVDAIVGESDCKYFFPPGYNESETETKQEKKKQKKKGKKHAAAINKEASVAVSELATDQSVQNETDIGEDDNEEQDSDEEKLEGQEDFENDSSVTGADKATSPIHESTTE